MSTIICSYSEIRLFSCRQGLKTFISFYGINPSRCPPGAETDDPEGRCCVLPFAYKRDWHLACISIVINDRFGAH